MSRVLDQLHQDHANMAKLLDLLEREMAGFAAGEAADFDLVREIVRYVGDYPATCHHPKEDLVFARLAERDPNAKELAEALMAEHRTLAEVNRDFARLVEQVAAAEVELPRAAFAEQARAFLGANREHMGREEQDILRRARAALSAADWDEIDATIRANDPLFGSGQAAHYDRLRKRVLDPA